jgi:hypothetical protein
MHGNDRTSFWVAGGGIALAVLAALLFVAMPRIREAVAERRCGHRHLLAMSSQPPFLTDDLALGKAFEALAAQGFDTNKWLPATYSRTKAPDGTDDRFLCRNVVDDNSGVIRLTNAVGNYRYVQVSLRTNFVEVIVRWARSPGP